MAQVAERAADRQASAPSDPQLRFAAAVVVAAIVVAAIYFARPILVPLAVRLFV